MKQFILVMLVSLLLAACAPSETTPSTVPSNELSLVEREALAAALQDEYRAEAIYAQVINDFGAVRPFTNIVQAEVRHSSMVLDVYATYGLTPPNAVDYTPPSFATLADACDAAVQAEIENIALYERLLPSIEQETVRTTFIYLRDASRNNHLPAFQRCGGRS